MRHRLTARASFLAIIASASFASNAVSQGMAGNGDAARCVTIDFETMPGEAPVEGMVIRDQFRSVPGMTFALEDGSYPHLAQVGDPTTAFLGKGSDGPAPGQDVGSFFLTDDGVLKGSVSSPLIIDFTFPVDSASGDVLDIDYTERFSIEARDRARTVLETLVIAAGDPATGNGVATRWGFGRPSADVASIRFEGTRRSGRFGLGFDNLTTCAPGREEPPADPSSAGEIRPAPPQGAEERRREPSQETGRRGFVTGGGWFVSPPGAYRADLALSGRANFGMVAGRPGGRDRVSSVEFQFQSGSIDFHSTRVEEAEIVDDGTGARLYGFGTVNREAAVHGDEYRFTVWLREGRPDEFRIRIWSDGSGVVYDSGRTVPLGGGSIVIHERD